LIFEGLDLLPKFPEEGLQGVEVAIEETEIEKETGDIITVAATKGLIVIEKNPKKEVGIGTVVKETEEKETDDQIAIKIDMIITLAVGEDTEVIAIIVLEVVEEEVLLPIMYRKSPLMFKNQYNQPKNHLQK
jgi:hypothetical protein